LAALLEFGAHGIEVDSTLVRASRRSAPEFGLPFEFAQGSFIPADDRLLMWAAGTFA
jgi:hypothetical protein